MAKRERDAAYWSGKKLLSVQPGSTSLVPSEKQSGLMHKRTRATSTTPKTLAVYGRAFRLSPSTSLLQVAVTGMPHSLRS